MAGVITVLLRLTTAGVDTGPFDIYTNVDDYVVPIQEDISRQDLVSGYLCTNVPYNAIIVRVMSKNNCTNYADAEITGIPTPTPTPTITPTITPTNTPTPTPTPTPQDITYTYQGTTNDYATSTLACQNILDNFYYSDDNELVVGSRIYTDVDLLYPYVGDDRLWKRLKQAWSESENEIVLSGAYKINDTGYITQAAICSDVQ